METRCSHLIKSHTRSSNTDNCQKQNLNDNDIPFPACKTARTSQLDPIKLNHSVELFWLGTFRHYGSKTFSIAKGCSSRTEYTVILINNTV